MNRLLLLTFALLVGCATKYPMASVIDACNTSNTSFAEVYQCIYLTYTKHGRSPNATAVKAFYAEMAAINEAVNSRKISQVQAKAAMYRAYSKTVDADNRASQANQGVVCMPVNGMMICQ